jgi:hypothetical protein
VSNLEIKSSIDQMNDDQRVFAAAYLQHLSQQRDDSYRQLLAERLNRLDEGRPIGLEQLQRLHDALHAEGI